MKYGEISDLYAGILAVLEEADPRSQMSDRLEFAFRVAFSRTRFPAMKTAQGDRGEAANPDVTVQGRGRSEFEIYSRNQNLT